MKRPKKRLTPADISTYSRSMYSRLITVKRFIIISLTILPVIMLGVYALSQTHRNLTDLVLSRRQALTVLTANVVEERFNRLIAVGSVTAERPSIKRLVEEGRWNEAVLRMKVLPNSTDYVERIFLTDPKGIEKADFPSSPGVIGRDFSHRDWYKGVSKEWKPYVSEIYLRAAKPQKKVVAVAIPIIKDLPNGDKKVLGILVEQINLKSFLNWTGQIDLGKGGTSYFIDQRGSVVSSVLIQRKYHNKDILEKVFKGKSGVETKFDPISKKDEVISFAPVRGFNWAVVLSQDASLAFASRDIEIRNLVFIFFALLLMLLALIFIRLRDIVKEQEFNSAKDEFLSIAAHQLRTPLGATRWNIEMLINGDYGKVPDKIKEELRAILANNLSLTAIVNDLLDVSRINQKKVKVKTVSADAYSIILDVINKMKIMAGQKSIQINLGKINNEVKLDIDPSLFSQIIQNLIVNAIKYNKEKGKVFVEFKKDNNHLTIFIKDTGIGIPKKQIKKVSEKFFRADNALSLGTEGTGLGLFIAKSYVKILGGKISISSEENAGTTVRLDFPI